MGQVQYDSTSDFTWSPHLFEEVGQDRASTSVLRPQVGLLLDDTKHRVNK